MKCPKCSNEIPENSLKCPSCHKVLKLVCPVCGALNKSNTCTKCGFVIVTKCHKCGHFNETIKEKCSNCGFSTYTSAAINSSNIDEFACLTVEFSNLDNFKDFFGSTKLADKFKENLDSLIVNYTNSCNLRRERVNNFYIIRFNKDTTFSSSAFSAIEAAIAIQTLVAKLNFKLNKLKGVSLACNIAISKRDIYSRPSDYRSGVNIKLIYQNTKELKMLNNLQVIVDNSIYKVIHEKYLMAPLSAIMVKQKMVMFFELNLKKYIDVKQISEPEKVEKSFDLSSANLPDEEEIQSAFHQIAFSDVNCDFKTIENIDAFPAILDKIKNNTKNIISVKKYRDFVIDTESLCDEIQKIKHFDNIVNLNCTDEMLFRPYGVFAEIISQLFNYSQNPVLSKLNDFSNFGSIDDSNYLADFINLNKRTFPNPEDCRYSVFDIISTIFLNLKNTLIIIDNADKIDDTSFEFLQSLFRKFSDLDVTFVLINSNNFAVHKHSHFLLSCKEYSEFTLKKTKIKHIYSKYLSVAQAILNTNYFDMISKNTNGNFSYFEMILNLMVKEQVLASNNESLSVSPTKNIMLPPTVDAIIQLQMKNLKHFNKNAFDLYSLLVLSGKRFDYRLLSLLKIEDDVKLIKYLISENSIIIRGNIIVVRNYDFVLKQMLAILSNDEKQLAVSKLLSLYSDVHFTSDEFKLYKYIDSVNDEFITLQNLSEIGASLGDFSAYWQCCHVLLKMIANHISSQCEDNVKQLKMCIYENLTSLLYKYTPEKIQGIAQVLLDNLENKNDDNEIVVLCNKMLQGCLISGNYSNALKLIHNILSRFSDKSINPNAENFDITPLMLSLVKVEILFSIGDLNDCAKAGDEIIKLFTNKNLLDYKPENVSQKQFSDLVFDSFVFAGLSKVLLLKDDLNTYITNLKNAISVELPYSFDLLIVLSKLLHGYNAELNEDLSIYTDKFSFIFANLIYAFTKCMKNPELFANVVHKIKIHARNMNLMQFELFCDALIGM